MPFEPVLPPIRSLLLPDPGWVLVDADFDRADAQIVAWSADEPELKHIFQQGIDVHTENAEWCTRAAGKTVVRQAMKAGIHLCLTEDHDVLTRQGWVSITEKPSELMCWDYGVLNFSPIKYWFDQECLADLLEWDDYSFSQKVTKNHTLPYKTDRYNYRAGEAQHLPKTARLPKSGIYVGGSGGPSPLEARLWCAIQADASRQKLQWTFHLKKTRKIDRLHSLLRELGLEFVFSRYVDGTTRTAFCWPEIPKRLGSYVFDWSQAAIDAYVLEAVHWDGHQAATSQTFTTVDQAHSHWFSTLVHLTGKGSQGGRHGLGYTVSINNRPLYRLTPPFHSQERVRLLCPTTATGFFLVRRHGKISVTGNTNYGGKASTLATTLGVDRDTARQFQEYWFRRFPGISRWHDRTRRDLKIQHYIRNVWGFRRFYFDRLQQDVDVERLLPQALAWQGQSGVAIAINHAMKKVRGTFSRDEVRLRLQVHDSLLLQVREDLTPKVFPTIRDAMRVRIPFDDPLYIPVSLKWSASSWGDVKKWDAAKAA